MAQAATLHDGPSTSQRGQCETVRHRLPERREIGSEPVELLSAAKVEAESRDHFVESEKCAVRGTRLYHDLLSAGRGLRAATGALPVLANRNHVCCMHVWCVGVLKR